MTLLPVSNENISPIIFKQYRNTKRLTIVSYTQLVGNVQPWYSHLYEIIFLDLFNRLGSSLSLVVADLKLLFGHSSINIIVSLQIVGDRGATFQSNAADIHKPSSVMVMGLPNQNAVGCWNINKPLNTISIVHRDDQKMVYPSDVKVSNDRMYVLTNKLPRFFYGRLNYDEINFRVWSNTIGGAIQGTECV